MARYGDIVEINGEFFEFTPVGYMPVKGREGMLTKPAPTTKQTVPVGTPTSDPTKTQPGETGPFDPNAEPPAPAPAPAPAPEPQQTGPIGIPSSDPTKRQAGETDPIDPNSSAVETIETAPTDTPTTAPVRQEEEAIYPYMYTTRDLGSGARRESWQNQQVNFLTQSQLQIEFNENSDLKRTFGDFNNYLSYMDGMLALAEEHPEIAWWDIGRLDSTTGETYDATSDPSSYYYGMEEEDMRSGSTALIDANQNRTNEIRAALEAMNALPGYQQLLQDHNVDLIFQNNDGDVFQFNGLNSAEIYEVDDSATPYIKAAIELAIGLMVGEATGAFSSFLSEQATLGNLGETLQVVSQVFGGFEQAGYSVSQAASTLNNANVIMNMAEAVNELEEGEATPEQIVTIVSEAVSAAEQAGEETTETAQEIIEAIEEESTTPVEEEPDEPPVVETPDNEYEPEFPIEETVDPDEEPGAGAEVPTDEEVPPDEDIFADTTQEATGFEDSVVRELLDEYIQPVLASLEDQDAQLEGIQVNIDGQLQTITAEQQEAYQELVRQGGMLTDLDANQQEIIQEMGGTQRLLDSVVDNVSELSTGLEAASEEREAIRQQQEQQYLELTQGQQQASEEREAGFTAAEQARQLLMEAIVAARGDTTALSEEMRDLLAQSNQTMQEMFEGTGVDIDELRSGQLSQEEATNALRDYTEQEFGAVREQIETGFTQAQQERQELMEAWIAANGDIENLSEEMRAAFEASNQTVEELFAGTNINIEELRSGQISQAQATADLRDYTEQEFGAVRGELEEGFAEASGEREQLGSDLLSLQQQTGEFEQQTGERFEEAELARIQMYQGLLNVIEQYRQGQATELSEAQLETLSRITGVEERLLEQASNDAEAFNNLLADQNVQFGEVTDALRSDIVASEERLTQRVEEFEQQTGQRFDEATQARTQIYEGLLGRLEEFQRGAEVDLSETEIRVLSEVTGLEERLLEQAAQDAEQFNTLLAEQGIQFEEVTDAIRSDIVASEERITGRLGEFEQQTGERFDEATQARIEMYQGLLGRLDEFRRGAEVDLSETELRVLSEVTGVEERLLQQASENAEEFNALLADQGVRFEEVTDAIRSDIFASEERLTGQIGGLTEDVARVAEDVIRADGRIEEMSAESQQRYNELGLDIEDLSTLVGVNIEALRDDIITQDSALRELFENQGEQLGQDIEDLNTKLEDAREGFSVELSETEANILSEITGLESDFLQSMGELEGGLQDAFGEGFENVQGQVEGIGQQVAGVESRIGEVEEGIGGLESQFQEGLEGLLRFGLGSMFGLGQQQQQISEQQMQQAAMLAARPEIDPFQKQEFAGLGYEAYQDPGMLTQQQPTAQENLAQLIGRLA
jgi:hypothetical protein